MSGEGEHVKKPTQNEPDLKLNLACAQGLPDGKDCEAEAEYHH